MRKKVAKLKKIEIDEFTLIDEIKKYIINSDKVEVYNELSERFEWFDVWNEKGEIGRFINTDSMFARNLAANILFSYNSF